MVLYPFRRLYHTGTPPLERGEAGWEARCHTPPPLEPAHTISGSSRPFISATPLGVTSAVRVWRGGDAPTWSCRPLCGCWVSPLWSGNFAGLNPQLCGLCGTSCGLQLFVWVTMPSCEAADPYPPSPRALAARQAPPIPSHFFWGTEPYPTGQKSGTQRGSSQEAIISQS